MALLGTIIIWDYFNTFQDAQTMQAILNEQCPEKNIIVDMNDLDYDPMLNWSNGEVQCFGDLGKETITCFC